MRIAILAPCWFPVPPVRYGGIERVVALLADGLVDDGHEVTLFAAGGSRTRARLVTPFDVAPSARLGQAAPDLHHALACYARAGDFDLVNDHSGLVGASLAGTARGTPVCHTVHGPMVGEPGEIYRQIGAAVPSLRLISLSMAQRTPCEELNWLANCHNALDLDAYPLVEEKDDYLVFLGRLAPEKGTVTAIQTARALGMPLRMAGKMQEPAELAHFEHDVRPLLGDGIEYLGEVSEEQKLELLQHARLTLFPIDWEEPFGLVMIESMACGTPVLATRRGAVPEVVEDGVSGVIVDSPHDLAPRAADAMALRPAACRASVEARFSPRHMVEDYREAYERLVAEA